MLIVTKYGNCYHKVAIYCIVIKYGYYLGKHCKKTPRIDVTETCPTPSYRGQRVRNAHYLFSTKPALAANTC